MQLISISAVLLLTATTVERAGLTALSGKTWRQREDLQPQQWWRCSLRSLMVSATACVQSGQFIPHYMVSNTTAVVPLISLMCPEYFET